MLFEITREHLLVLYISLTFPFFSQQTLTTLNLWANEIHAEGAHYLAEAFRDNKVNINLILYISIINMFICFT